MKLEKITDRIYYLPHEPEVDRPMLAYVKGDKWSLAIDAGYSESHVKTFYQALQEQTFPTPDFTVITHWHYDHTFGMHAIQGTSIAHCKTNLFLKEQQEKAKDKNYIHVLKQEDTHFAREYAEQKELKIVMADLEYERKLTLDLGKVTASIFHTASPHSEDTTCIFIPEEKVFFLGDSTSEDFFHDGYMDQGKLKHLIETIQSIECKYCILSHCEPLKKEELLAYLEGINR